MQLIEHSDSPRYIRLHERDNVVVVVNDQGVPAGTEFADGPSPRFSCRRATKSLWRIFPKAAR